MEINRNIEMSVYYRLTSLSSNAQVAFVELGIVCLYVIPHIFLSEERLAAQLQERIKCEYKKKPDIEVQWDRTIVKLLWCFFIVVFCQFY